MGFEGRPHDALLQAEMAFKLTIIVIFKSILMDYCKMYVAILGQIYVAGSSICIDGGTRFHKLFNPPNQCLFVPVHDRNDIL